MTLGVGRIAWPRVDDDDDALVYQRGGLTRLDANLRQPPVLGHREETGRPRRGGGGILRSLGRGRTRGTGSEVDARRVSPFAPVALDDADDSDT